MRSSSVRAEFPVAQSVAVSRDTLCVVLNDGRTICAPLAWYPRLVFASAKERANWRLIGRGQGIHWEDLDEDISIENLIVGRPSGESQSSLKKWLASRNAPRQIRGRRARQQTPLATSGMRGRNPAEKRKRSGS